MATWRGSPPLMVRSESLVSLATLLEQRSNALQLWKKSTVENKHISRKFFWAFCTKNQSVIYSSSLQFCKSKKREKEEEKLIGAID